MITFNEFLEHKRVEAAIAECVHLMVEMDIDPHQYIYECLKEIDPALAEGWMDGVKNFAGNVWKGVQRFAGDTAKGVAAGAKGAADAIAGPAAKFDAASRAMEDLAKILKRPEFEGFMFTSTEGKKENLAGYIQKVLGNLRDSRNQMPAMANTEVKQDYATRGAVKAQNAPGPQKPAEAGQQGPSDREKFGYPPAAATAGRRNPGMSVAS